MWVKVGVSEVLDIFVSFIGLVIVEEIWKYLSDGSE